MDASLKTSSVAAEETLDPSDWTEVQALSHQILDDAVGYLRDVRNRSVWQDIPSEVKAFVGVKWNTKRGWRESQASTLGCLWVA